MIVVKRILFGLIILFGSFGLSKADHVVGSDIVYRCLGNGKYEITFKFFRDCNGCNVSGGGGGGTGASCPHPRLVLTGANGSCNGQNLGNITVTRKSITDITQLCGTSRSACAGGTFPYGIEEHLYTGIIDLSARIAQGCCKFKISTTIFVRSTTISTGASNQAFYTEAIINACDSVCNSSPEYTSYPVAIICVGQDFVFNNGAIDTVDNGDSLSYQLAPAFRSSSNKVTYSGSFSKDRPLSFLGFPNAGLVSPAGFHLDPVTGDLSFRPTKTNQTGVIVIEVIEWRRINGIMKEIGRTRRDMQVIVVSCPNNKIPRIKGKSAVACAGQQVCIDITTEDENKKDTVQITWNRGIRGAVFTNTNGSKRLATGSVCWTPSEADVSNIPYTFTITAKDDACPLSGVSIRAFSITVREAPKAELKFTRLTCGMVAMEATPEKQYPGGLEVEWRVRDSLNKTYFIGGNSLKDTLQMRPGKNIVTLILKTNTPCTNAFVDTVDIDPYVQVELPNDTFICKGDAIQLNAKTTYGIAPYKYQWNTSVSDTLKTLSITPTNDTTVYVQVSDDEGCSYTDTIKMLFKEKPLIWLDTGKRICFNDFVQLDAGNDTFPSNYTYLWNTTDTGRTIFATDSNFYIATVTDSIGCQSIDTFKLYVNEVPTNLGPDKTICDDDTAKLQANGADSYKWYKLPDPAVIGVSNAINQVLNSQTSYRVTGEITYDGVTCENDDTITISINPLPTIIFTNITDKCAKSVAFNLNEGIQFPTINTGTWVGLDNPNWVKNNVFYPDSVTVTNISGFQTMTVRYDVEDGNGCKNSQVTTFRVIKLPEVNVKDSSVCADKGIFDLYDVVLSPTNTAPGTWKWTSTSTEATSAILGVGPVAQFDIGAVTQATTYPFCLDVTNLFGCPNSACLNITVREVPIVNAGFISPKCENDTLFKLSNSIGLMPSNGGIWQSPTGGVVNTDWFNPAIVTVGNHDVIYTYDIPGNNCPVSDTLVFTVKPKPIISLVSPAALCASVGTVNFMSNASPTGGTWSGSGIIGNGDFDAANNIGTTNFRYDYTSANGCSHFITGSVLVDAIPTVAILTPPASCAGIPLDMEGQYTNATGIMWTASATGGFNSVGAVKTIYTQGAGDADCVDITLSTNGSGACPAATQTLNVCFYPIPSAEIVANPEDGCQPLFVNFNAITDLPNNAKYEWDFGDPQSADNIAILLSPTHIYNTNGSFSVNLKVTSENNCVNTAPAKQIIVYPKPVANIDANYWITTVLQTAIQFKNTSTIVAPSTIVDMLWKFGNPDSSVSTANNPTFEYSTDSGSYWVSLKVVSDRGCEDETRRKLVILPSITVFIPNAFIPDGVGHLRNERFYITATDYSFIDINVFSRWGELIYQSNDINEGWDGRYKGELVPSGVYTYVVNITDLLNQPLSYKGTITLLR